MRQSGNEIRGGAIWNGYSYTLQVWIKDGRIESCAHPEAMNCQCFAKRHAHEEVRVPA